MKEWNIHFTLRGPVKTLEVPCSTNPVECANLASLLAMLAQNLPSPMGTECVGIRVEPVNDNSEAT